MAQFMALASPGMIEALASELQELDVKVGKQTRSGVFFEGSWRDCYRVNLHSRIASRVLKPVLDFTAYQPEELYAQVLKHDFTKYIDPNQNFKVEAAVRDSKLHDQRFIAMKTKDAIADQFREKFGERPNVEKENPDMSVFIRGVKNNFAMSIDTTGLPLFMRGYRLDTGEAPLKETLAAGLLRVAGWDRQSPIIDPMCGSGTLLIEAALMASQTAPGLLRRGFAFQNLKGFDEELWDSLVDEASSAVLEELPFKLYGFDSDRKVIAKAKANAKKAGVEDLIEFKVQDVAMLEPPCEKGLVITNPPYGARIGEEVLLKDTYRDLSYSLKHRFKGWDAWILAGNKDLTADLKLKCAKKHFLFNGNIECRFLQYQMF